MIGMNLQNLLIRYILKPFSRPLALLGEKGLQRLNFFCFLGIFVIQFLYRAMPNLRYMYFLLPSCLLLGIVILCGVTKETHPVQWNWLLLLPWCGVAVLSCVAAVRINVEYFTDGALFLIAIPVFWMVWGQRDTAVLFQSIAKAAKWSFWLLLPILVIFYPVGGAGYYAFFGNPNSLAIYLTIVFCAFAFECLTIQKINLQAIINYISAGLCAALIYYTGARCGEYTCIIALVMTGGLLIICQRRRAFRILLHSVLPILVATVICIPTTLNIMYTGHEFVNSMFVASEETPGEAPEETPGEVPEEAPGEAPEETPGEAPEETQGETPEVVPDFETIEQFNNYKDGAYLTSGLDGLTGGRIEVWRTYASHLNLWGHGNEPLYYPDGREVKLSAHQTILNISYLYGLIAGICYLIFNLGTGLCVTLYALRKRENSYELFPFLFTVAFGAISLIESISGPFVTILPLIYYLSQTPFILKQSSTRDKKVLPENEENSLPAVKETIDG